MAEQYLTEKDMLQHENDAAKRINKLKEGLVEKIEKDRHDSKGRDQVLQLDITENKEALSLFQQSQKYMEKKIDNIETHLKDGISDLKSIIEKQGRTFATKSDHEKNSKEIELLVERQDKYDKWFSWGMKIIGSVILLAILGLILI